mmetsp:Transcript_11576/g.25740  ORF Transcript_11576/g.25740 Transcript_11576/m.25740 type:complete len:417 (-) Transcript_11576:636-1886(-)
MMLLRMGQDLTKLLTADPSSQTLSTLDRPSSADWRAVSTVQNPIHKSQSLDSSGFVRTQDFRPSANHRAAAARAIGIRTSDTRDQPNLPQALRDPADSRSAVESVYSAGLGQSYSGTGLQESSMGAYTAHTNNSSPQKGGHALEHGSHVSGNLGPSGGGYDVSEVKNEIAERERHFFKEVSLNPNLKDQHPLMHLISAQQKIKLIDQQSGVLNSSKANKSESIFGTRYGKQAGDGFKPNGAYAAEIPYAVNGEIILPSKLRQRKQEEARRARMVKAKSLKSLLDPSMMVTEANKEDKEEHTIATPSLTSNPNAESSRKHRDFLAEALGRIESSMANAAPYEGHYTGGIDEKTEKLAQLEREKTGVATSAKGSVKKGSQKGGSVKSRVGVEGSARGIAEGIKGIREGTEEDGALSSA